MPNDHEQHVTVGGRRPPPSTLSRLMTTSATMMIQIASEQRRALPHVPLAAAASSDWRTSLMAIQISRRPPTTWSSGNAEQVGDDGDEGEAQADRAHRAPHAARGTAAAGAACARRAR